MRTLLFSILLALITLVSQAQTATSTTTTGPAQTELRNFEADFKATGWSTMTVQHRTDFVFEHYRLKIAAAKEADVERINAEAAAAQEAAAQAAAATTARQQFIDKLKSLGYLCDNSQTDWDKLYNRPEMFSSIWQAQANYQKSISPGIDYFLQQAQQILFMPYEIGKAYKIGDSFAYAGIYYKVIQAHTSQAGWIPGTVPALYTQITATGTVAEWKQPTGAQDAYKKGDKVLFSGSTYESMIDANVWSPTAYPQGWKKL